MDQVPIQLHIERLPEGVYLATSPDVQGLIAEGETIDLVIEYAKDCIRMIVESCIEHGDPLPPKFAQNPDPNVTAFDVVIPVKRIEAA